MDEVRTVEPGEPVEPVELVITQECHFVAKPCKTCGLPKSNRVHSPKKTATCEFRKQLGCASCGRAKKAREHMGAPPSLNVLGSGDPRTYISLKEQWQEALTELLVASGLPKGLGRVMVEGEVTFPDRARRDQGNFRVLVEKALGDALDEGGWLDDDDWSRYEFGNLAQLYQADVSQTRLLLFPQAPRPQDPPAQGSLLPE